MIKFSVIIPVYNRPDEIVELLDSLTMQLIKSHMEVIVVEDGSTDTCEHEISHFKSQLDIQYIYQENTGPGLARNFGAQHAKGEYLLFFDSDCVIPSDYFNKILEHLKHDDLDCFGGPDKAHAFFSPIQKAISYSMTSVLTTGGIRGGKRKLDKFYPRSFNLGVKRDKFNELGGFSNMRFGEDLDFSLRAHQAGLKIGLVSDTFVYHKRRNTFRSFFKQVFNSGAARVKLTKRHKGSLKIVHLFPSLFVLSIPVLITLAIFWCWLFILPYIVLPIVIFADAIIKTKSVQVAFMSTYASLVQTVGYGLGFISALWVSVVKKKEGYQAFKKTFYN